MLRVFAYSCCYLGDAGVDPAVIESQADELIGSVSKDEYKALAGHLGGARRNRVFHALGLSAPPRSAELKLAEGHGGPEKAKALEKAKRKKSFFVRGAEKEKPAARYHSAAISSAEQGGIRRWRKRGQQSSSSGGDAS